MISVEKFLPQDWKQLSAQAHLIAFQEHRPPEMERIDYALVASRDGVLAGYVTCREFDSETLYWQFSGTFPGTRKTSVSWLVYMALVGECRLKYKRITALIRNDNVVMLKMALKMGFRVQGIRVYADTILLEHLMEFKDV